MSTATLERTLTPREELLRLEEEAVRKGISPEQLSSLRAIGECPSQIQMRISILRRWLEGR